LLISKVQNQFRNPKIGVKPSLLWPVQKPVCAAAIVMQSGAKRVGEVKPPRIDSSGEAESQKKPKVPRPASETAVSDRGI